MIIIVVKIDKYTNYYKNQNLNYLFKHLLIKNKIFNVII